ncbi:ketose-bisphosphate aldolase [Actinopolymorpha alba]|uniref:ketose-bisphosphate aldolase n=1 Tax=Actinopolymorpha alba TaxID=533267 RepID=UPI00037E9063|nr:ketose-bisphosphate aldolase [Actinopolymorpha alba]
MTFVTLLQALDEAAAGDYALGAFNVSDLVQAEAVLDAAAATASPVIVQAIAGGSAHASDERFWGALVGLIKTYDEVPVVLHLDHGPDFATCARAIAAGFTSVMIDGSLRADRRTPSSFEENVAVTAEVVEYAHAGGVSVEGELGTIGGVEGGTGEAKEIVLADPDQAAEFVRRTGVDALAVAIGTSHGAYKFDREPDGEVLRLDLTERIHALTSGTHLVMHGSSTLPAELRAEVNAYGGTLPESWGVPMAEKVRSIGMGVRKINQGMDSHLAFTAAVRRTLATDGLNVDPAGYERAGREAMRALLVDRMRDFRSAGQAKRPRS